MHLKGKHCPWKRATGFIRLPGIVAPGVTNLCPDNQLAEAEPPL